jgi:putative tricarboxylic transport membrane protein
MADNTAATWRPEREVQIVAGTPPGGGQDRPARALIEVLDAQNLLGQPVTLVNMPGRGGGNAWDYLMRHRGDPHVLAINSPTIVSNRLLGVSTLTYDDLTPLANLYTEYPVFTVRADSTLAHGDDLLGRLQRDTAGVRIALATAIGNTNHIALAQVTEHAGGDIKALAIDVFDSARDAIAHVVGGHAELGVITAVSAMPELTAGSLRALAVSAPARLNGLFATVPTWLEDGVECRVGMWRGVIAPPDMQQAATAFWDRTLAAATRSETWRAVLAEKFWADTYLGVGEVRAFLAREGDLMTGMLGELGLLPDIQRSVV